MLKKILSHKTNHECTLETTMDSSINLGIMSTEQYNDYLIKDFDISTESSNVKYTIDGMETVKVATFKHPIYKTKFNLVYDTVNKELLVLPDMDLYLSSSKLSKLSIMGYGIGYDDTSKPTNDYVNAKKTYTPYKIELEESLISTMDVKLAVLNIPGTYAGTDSGKFSNNLTIDAKLYMDNGFYPTCALIIKFAPGVLKSTDLNTSVLTTINFNEDRLVNLSYTQKEFIEENIVFLSL